MIQLYNISNNWPSTENNSKGLTGTGQDGTGQKETVRDVTVKEGRDDGTGHLGTRQKGKER